MQSTIGENSKFPLSLTGCLTEAIDTNLPILCIGGWMVWFVGFYGISTFVGYLMPNPFLCK